MAVRTQEKPLRAEGDGDAYAHFKFSLPSIVLSSRATDAFAIALKKWLCGRKRSPIRPKTKAMLPNACIT